MVNRVHDELATMMHCHIIIIKKNFTNYGNNSSPLLNRLLVYLTAEHNHFSIIYKYIHYTPFLLVVLPERSLRVPQHVRDRRRGSVPDLLNWGEYTDQHKMPEDTVSRIDVCQQDLLTNRKLRWLKCLH